MEFIDQSNLWLVYLGLFIGPFIQEDTAVLGAASLSVSQPDHWITIFAVILVGLIASDSWKYWLGWAARRHQWAQKYTERPRVQALQSAVLDHGVKTLISVRFLPFARIPTYLATGFFGVPYRVYWLSISFSALLYVALFFTGFHLLGEIIGERLKDTLALIGIGFGVCLLIGFGVRALLKRRTP